MNYRNVISKDTVITGWCGAVSHRWNDGRKTGE